MDVMTTPNLKLLPNKPRCHQRGAAVLILMLIVMLGLITIFSFRMDHKGPELSADRKTALALAQAKEALLGRAAKDSNHPGSLPCPDIDNSGDLVLGTDYNYGTGSCRASLGWIPWKTLDMGDTSNDPTQRLWYLQSSSFMDLNNTAQSSSINTTISGTLSTKGQSNLVAIIVAPGTPLTGQSRSTTPPFNSTADYAKYIEGYDPASPTIINSAALSSTYNDRIITISDKELFSVVSFRMAKDLASQNFPVLPLTFSGLQKSTVWNNNYWDQAVDLNNTSVTATSIILTFKKCAITYTITGKTSVTRSRSSC
jgi:hypothetical protein